MLPESAFEFFGENSGFIAELYQAYRNDASVVGEEWADFFKDLESSLNGYLGHYQNGTSNTALGGTNDTSSLIQLRAAQLIAAYRNRGHFKAKINPLARVIEPVVNPDDLSLEAYGIAANDLSDQVACDGVGGHAQMSLGDLVATLESTYSGSIGFEYEHLVSSEERRWLREKIEAPREALFGFSSEARKEFLNNLVHGATFESELNRRYPGQFRFSLEGGEGLLPLLEGALRVACEQGVSEVVFGMAHRGRLNVLVNTLRKPLKRIFSEFEDYSDQLALGTGDVKYHLGYFGSRSVATSAGEKTIGVQLVPNPSHLEFVNPVAQGVARAMQDLQFAGQRSTVLPLVMHGDSAFIGQGITTEAFNFSQVDGHKVGGTYHIVINNQVGFTTDPDEYRSSPYCTDFARAIGAPVFHVNAEDIEACVWIGQLAMEYRQKFGKDVVLDLVCYRRHGHNEADEPAYTQPAVYAEIRARKGIAALYGERLIAEGVCSAEDVAAITEAAKADFAAAEQGKLIPLGGDAIGIHGKLRGKTPASTGVKKNVLETVAKTLTAYPDGFRPHPKLQQILEKRVQTCLEDKGIDWGLGEILAFGSLMEEGVRVRLCGQDCGRGTFNQRHLALVDVESQNVFLPLNRLQDEQASGAAGSFEVYNSVLSESAILGFEFGYAAVPGNTLVIWEAQFGDFVNGAQVIIDQFIATSEAKWNQLSSLVLLLPHGYEGRGPEHSSARLERFLQLASEGNMTICCPSNSAQHFHMLRRHALSKVKRPLIVMTPKSLLRLPEAGNHVTDFTSGVFQPLLVDELGAAKRIVLCSGKVYYEVMAGLKEKNISDVRVVRLEQFYPLPKAELAEALKGKAKTIFWVQEEPKNMGAWHYMERALREEFELQAQYIGRVEAASPATGSGKKHTAEQKKIVSDLLAAL